jgi:integrase
MIGCFNLLIFSGKNEELDTCPDWLIFEQKARNVLVQIPSSHLDMAFRQLAVTLWKLFKIISLTPLEKEAHNPQLVVRFSKCLSLTVDEFKWSKNTAKKVLTIVRKLVKLIPFLRATFGKMIRLKFTNNQMYSLILGKKYGKLPVTDPSRLLLEGWVLMLRRKTNCRSDLSLRNIMSFYINKLVQFFHLSIDEWDSSSIETVSQNQVLQLCGHKLNKIYWTRLFLTNILPHVTHDINDSFMDVIKRINQDRDRQQAVECDNTDIHRISSCDLDKIYTQSRIHSVRAELVYLLMISTGMRIGGVVRIKTQHVLKKNKDGTMSAMESGKTLEKGNKWFSFGLIPRIQELLEIWICQKRPGDEGPYLFPGHKRGHLTTGCLRMMFHDLCISAGLTGSEFHPHALRHSYAHILLESGNTPEIVSKLLNHSNVATTEQFYLRENIGQIMARANVPWIKESSKRKKDPLPNFLQNVTTTPDDQAVKKKRIAHLQQQILLFQ